MTALLLAAALGAVDVSAYAMCDGVTDDTVGLTQAALTGEDLVFPERQVCLSSAALELAPGQSVAGHGAVLKRAPGAPPMYQLELGGNNDVGGLGLDGNRSEWGVGPWQTTGAIRVVGDRSYLIATDNVEVFP